MTEAPSQVLERIDRELRAFWAAPVAPNEPQKTRASTRNLIVVAGAPEVSEQWVSIVDEVLKVIPARAIVVGLDPDAPDALDGSTSAVCTPSEGGGPAVCSERVTLAVRGGLCTRLASCVDVLCATDVPTTLVWLGRVHVEDPTFAPLARDADRIILDAGQGSLAGLAQVVRWASARAAGERPGVADLAWTRLAPWQELCARMFDEPRLRELASRMTRIGIAQASQSGAAIGSEGGLLLGWLATRLGWKATSLAGKLRLVRPNDGVVRAELHAERATRAPRGALLALEVDAGAGALSLRGTITRQEGDADMAIWRLEVTVDGHVQRAEQRVRLRASNPARLLESTLRRPKHDQALGESASWADEVREELACG
jgi:glucose-6-phosphate dehydrogenase assembly protein OpcA